MILKYLGITPEQMALAAGQTLYMLFWGLLLGSLLGIPLGILLALTRNNGVLENRFVYGSLNYLVNALRSIPFIILLVAIMPFTKAIIGTRIGTKAALVPLIFYIVPFLTRLVEGSLLEVGEGIIETAVSMGATPLQIIVHFLIPEALGSLVLSLTTGAIGLLGATA
ncbi:MAG TPA: ABC transporter permease subunit, partial [Clostridia bacterium]|nr:ABC transporter permease subunit [Clostridia bacterium]